MSHPNRHASYQSRVSSLREIVSQSSGERVNSDNPRPAHPRDNDLLRDTVEHIAHEDGKIYAVVKLIQNVVIEFGIASLQ